MDGHLTHPEIQHITRDPSKSTRVESFLLRHPAVAQATVVGVPDARMGQVGKASSCGTAGCRRRS